MRHFPYEKAFLYVGMAVAFYLAGQVLAQSEVGLSYFLRGVGLVLLLPLLELQFTKIVVSYNGGQLEVYRRRWWSPGKKPAAYPLEGITRIVLRDVRRDWRKRDVGFDNLGPRHNWVLVAETPGDEFELLPKGHASRRGGRRIGTALASALGVAFDVEGHDVSVFS